MSLTTLADVVRRVNRVDAEPADVEYDVYGVEPDPPHSSTLKTLP